MRVFTLWMLIELMSYCSPAICGVMTGMKAGLGGAVTGFLIGACIGAAAGQFWYFAGGRIGVYIEKAVKPKRQEYAFAALYIAAVLSTMLTNMLTAYTVMRFVPGTGLHN